jgi:hypothetical protein
VPYGYARESELRSDRFAEEPAPAKIYRLLSFPGALTAYRGSTELPIKNSSIARAH